MGTQLTDVELLSEKEAAPIGQTSAPASSIPAHQASSNKGSLTSVFALLRKSAQIKRANAEDKLHDNFASTDLQKELDEAYLALKQEESYQTPPGKVSTLLSREPQWGKLASEVGEIGPSKDPQPVRLFFSGHGHTGVLPIDFV